MPPNKLSRYTYLCSICNAPISHFRRHIVRTHMPWYMCPAVACTSCQVAGDKSDLRRFHASHSRIEGESQLKAWFLLVNGFLLFISSCLGLGSLDALLGLVVAEQLAPLNSCYLEEEQLYLREYDRLAGLDQRCPHVVSPPSRVSEILHVYTIANILLRLDTKQRQEARLYCRYMNPDGSSPPNGHPVMKYHIIDGHFHMDQLAGRSLRSLRELEVQANSDINLVHAVANFVYPGKWGTISKLIGSESRLSFTLGVHPHCIETDNVDDLFTRLECQFQQHPTAVAVGEVGLDFTTACHCNISHDMEKCRRGKVEGQHRFLEKALRLADRLSKPVVIHCRDKGDGMAAKGVLRKFVDLNLTHLNVQRHCFVGDAQELKAWSSTLPNCFFSLSRKSVTNRMTKAALMHADHRRLLLETDSPYLSFDGDTGHGPWRVGKVAQALSDIVGVPVPELVRTSNSSLAKMFKISW